MQSRYTADMDLGYSGGAHQGMGYIQNMTAQYGTLSGTTDMVREVFTVSGGDRTVTTASVRVRRSSGNDPLVLGLYTGAGTLIEAVSVPASLVPISAAGSDNGGSVWVGVRFLAPHVLTNGQTYYLRLSCAASSEYTAAPIRKGTTEGMDGDTVFMDGAGQFGLLIEEIVGSALRIARPLLARRALRTEIPANLPLVECDAVLIERVLVNLLENAAKYTPADAEIVVAAKADAGAMTISVVDDGPGIRPGHEREIFDKFTRGDRESALSGVGLGLAICKSIVEAHGGTIVAENVDPHGAAFRLSLPLGAVPSIEASDPHEVERAT